MQHLQDLQKLQTMLQFYLGHMAWRPPSTGRDTPVEKELSSDARNATALAQFSSKLEKSQSIRATFRGSALQDRQIENNSILYDNYHKKIALAAIKAGNT